MNQPSQDYTTQDLLAFYDRVKPVLSEWLAKPLWTARETAMLCAGYIPHDTAECQKSAVRNQPESIQDGAPIDPHGYVAPDSKLYSYYLRLLTDKEPAPPRDMVQLLSPGPTTTSLMNVGGAQPALVTTKQLFRLGVLREQQWFFMIGNAVGLQVPALVPFSLLDKLSDRLNLQPVRNSTTRPALDQQEAISAQTRSEKFGQPEPVMTDLTSEAKPKAAQRMLRNREPLQITPEKRGFYTTEEVAGLTNLLPATLNKYARSGTHVEGFTPFKRQNGKSWHWRDKRQQAEYDRSATADKPKRIIK